MNIHQRTNIYETVSSSQKSKSERISFQNTRKNMFQYRDK